MLLDPLRKSVALSVLLLTTAILAGCGQNNSAPRAGVAPPTAAPAPVQTKPTTQVPSRLRSVQLNAVGLSIEPGAVLLTGSGQTQILRALNQDAQGNPLSLENQNLEWRSSNPDKVSITPLSTPNPTLEGRRFILSAWGKLDAPKTGTESCFVGVKLKNPQGQETTPGLILESTSYAKQSTVITVPAGFTLGELFVSNGSDVRCTLDDVSLVAAQATTVAPDTNLLTNTGLEEGLTGWGVAGNTNFTLEPRQGRAGSTALAVSPNGARGQIYPDLRLNTAYSLKVWGKLEGAAGNCGLGYKFRNAAGQIQEETVSFTGQDYTQHSLNLTTSANPDPLEVYIWNAGNGRCFADDFSLTTASLSTAWTPYGSELLQNGGFESDLQSWDSFGPQANLELVGEAHTGSKALRLNTNKAGQGQFVSNLGTEPPRSSSNDVVLVTALTDSGASDVTVEPMGNAALRSSAVPVGIVQLESGVQVVPAAEVVVAPRDTASGGGFSAQEIAAMRVAFPTSSAVLKRSNLAVGTLISLQTSPPAMGQVAEVVQRGEFSLVKIELAGPEKLFVNYDLSTGLKDFSSVATPPLQAQSARAKGRNRFSLPAGGNFSLECEETVPDGISAESLFKNENFALNPQYKTVQKEDGDSLLLGAGLLLSPTGGFSLGVESDLKASFKCSVGGLPEVRFPITIPGVPFPIPTSVKFTPNLSLEVDASKSPKLRIAWDLKDAKLAFQAVVRLENLVPKGTLPVVVDELGSSQPVNWAAYREKFKPNLDILRDAITGLLPATVSVTLRPLSLNIAWGVTGFDIPEGVPLVGGLGIPQLDVLNGDFDVLETKLTWAAPGYVLGQKDSPARFNIGYVNGELAIKSNSLTPLLDTLPELVKGPVKTFFEKLGEKLKVSGGQNFGQARFVPLKPSKAYLKINGQTPIEINPDGTQEIQIQPLDTLELVLEPQAGDPNTKGDVTGAQLEVNNETRYSSLANRAQVWDWTNREDLSKTQRIPFVYGGNEDLRSIRLAVPGQTPGTPPIPKDFQLGGTYNVSFEMCDQIARKGGVEWRFSADSRLLGYTDVTTANYIGTVKVSCGIKADFSVNGVNLPQDGQEVTLEDCSIPTPFEINVQARATLRNLSAKVDGAIFATRGELLGGSAWPAKRNLKFTDGPNALEAEAKIGNSDKSQTVRREFTVKCGKKDPILPGVNPPVIKANTIPLPAPRVVISKVCPGEPRRGKVDISVLFKPNPISPVTGNPLNTYTIRGYELVFNGKTLDNRDLSGSDSMISTSGSDTVDEGSYPVVFSAKIFNQINNQTDTVIFTETVNAVVEDKPASECDQDPPPTPASICPPQNGAYASPDRCRKDKTFGDPHILTKDGYDYSFQAVGEFVMTRSSVPDMPLEVQTRYKALGTAASLTSAVAARVGTDKVTAYSRSSTQLEVRVNGVIVVLNPSGAFEQTLSDGGKLSVLSNSATVVWKDGTNLTVRNLAPAGGHLSADLELHPRHKSQTIGLGGNYNDNPDDDLIVRGGSTALPKVPSFEQLYKEFGSSWRLSQSESMFDYAAGESTATFSNLNYPVAPRVITDAERAAAEATCRSAGITNPAVLRACIYDVTVTGDAAFAAAAALSDRNSGAISIDPANVVMVKGQTRTFNAQRPSGSSNTVEWTATGGVISTPSGNTITYTAPETPGTYTLSARVAGGTVVATSSVVVIDQRLSGETRFTLTWGDTPRDLDTHLWLPSSTPNHIYCNNLGTDKVCPFAQLDLDNKLGFGPEIMRVQRLTGLTGTYQLWVFNYSSGIFNPSNTLVKVTNADGSELLTIPMTPNVGTGRWWHVLNFDAASGEIKVINTVGDLVEPYPDTQSGCQNLTGNSARSSLQGQSAPSSGKGSDKPAWPVGVPYKP